MTRFKLYCPYCERYTLRYPEEVTVELPHRGADTGIIRWEHCGVIRHRPDRHIVAKVLAAGAQVEYFDEEIDREVDSAHRLMADVKYPADMGFVS